MPIFGVPVLEDLPDVRGRSVIVRVDFNVPMQGVRSPTTCGSAPRCPRSSG
jgi:hypothetical protein